MQWSVYGAGSKDDGTRSKVSGTSYKGQGEVRGLDIGSIRQRAVIEAANEGKENSIMAQPTRPSARPPVLPPSKFIHHDTYTYTTTTTMTMTITHTHSLSLTHTPKSIFLSPCVHAG